VAGAREALVDARAVEQFKMRGVPNRCGRALGYDPQLLLRAGQRRLDVEPSLPAVLELVQRTDAGVGNTGGGRQFVTHGLSSER